MTTLARYVPEDRVLDLTKLALVDYRLVADLHGKIERGQPVLLSLETGGDPELYIRKSGGKYWACHYPGGAHGRYEVALMSDEHRRATDYIVRAADDAGYRTATEVTTSNRTRFDAVIFGNRVAGAEVQWSHIGTPDARTRTKKSLRATALVGTAAQDLAEGVLPVWFSPSGGRPDWLYRHHRGGLRAAGLRVAYERSWDGLTPDWTVLSEDDQPLAFVEVHTDQPPLNTFSQILAWHHLLERIKAIPVPVILQVASDGGPLSPPATGTARKIARDLPNQLVKFPRPTVLFSQGYRFHVMARPPARRPADALTARDARSIPSAKLAGRSSHRATMMDQVRRGPHLWAAWLRRMRWRL